MTLESPSGTVLENVAAVANPSPANLPDEVVDAPVGFFEFVVNGDAPGMVTTVTLILMGVDVNTYYKFGKTPDFQTHHSYEFLFDGTTSPATWIETQQPSGNESSRRSVSILPNTAEAQPKPPIPPRT